MKKILSFSFLIFASFALSAQVPSAGLVGYWPFTGNANDMSGNAYHGVVTGATLTTDRFGNPNKAYAFGDTSKYITIADAVPLRLSNTDFTISSWINQSNILSDQEAILSKRDIGIQNGYILNITGAASPVQGLVNYQVSGGTDPKVLSDTLVSQNAWHHVVVVYTLSDQRLRMYIDGFKQADTTGIPSPAAGATANLVIGKDGSSGSYAFHGKIDDVAMYNRALSLSEIQQLNSPCGSVDIASNIITQYDFSGNANDLSGNNHHGTASGGATLTMNRFYIASNAFAFNGASSTITVPDASALRLNNTDFTISAWIYQDGSVPGNAAILSKRTGSGQNGYIFNIGGFSSVPPGRLSFNVSGGIDPKAISDSVFTAYFWHHIAVVYDLSSETMLIYIDGLLNSATPGIPSPNAATVANLEIGSDGAGNPYFFNGKIDDLRIYNRALSPCDMDSLFKAPIPYITGINPVESEKTFELFPNPAGDYIIISKLKQGKITIRNTMGQVMNTSFIHSSSTKIDLAALPSGLYIIEFQDASGNLQVKKLIKD